jgi:Macrocin-O-methyltransferase (TylF)
MSSAAKIPGNIVECGSARGGTAALTALTLQRLGVHRKVWLFDTFEGLRLPVPTANDPDFELADRFSGTSIATLDEVRSVFEQLNATDGVEFVKGLFEGTIPYRKSLSFTSTATGTKA